MHFNQDFEQALDRVRDLGGVVTLARIEVAVGNQQFLKLDPTGQDLQQR
jgi:hypothetical protein